MNAVLPSSMCTRAPDRAPSLPPKARAVTQIDWTIPTPPTKMATATLEKELKASRELIALYKERISSKDSELTRLRAERSTLETQIKASNALVKSANGMETLLQTELDAAIGVQNDFKKKLVAAESELKAKDEALRIAQRAVDRETKRVADEMTLQARLEASEKELKPAQGCICDYYLRKSCPALTHRVLSPQDPFKKPTPAPAQVPTPQVHVAGDLLHEATPVTDNELDDILPMLVALSAVGRKASENDLPSQVVIQSFVKSIADALKTNPEAEQACRSM